MPAAPSTAPVRLRPASADSSGLPLVGTWSVRRKIVDHLAATTSRFEGTATVTPDRFQEEGHLTLGASRLRATRAYRLCVTPQAVTVTFCDGSEFIVLDRKASQKVRHVCGADIYVGHFFFVDAGTWVETWRVAGPRKRYASLTRYTALVSQVTGDGRPETGG